MVFPSIPVYLDPPNWNQQPQAHHIQPGSSNTGGGGGGGNEALLPPLPLGAAAAPRQEGLPMPGLARPGSMSERARLAKIPQPELALKCPRCDSTNTKFCYYNNYSLTQPRHFCKTCRRYWTRGGALRNVPVGGGCRRNKRSSKSGGGSSSKSSAATATTDRHSGASPSRTSSTGTSAAGMGCAIPSNISLPHQLPFLASLHHPIAGPDYGAPNLGLTFPTIQHMDGIDYHVGGGSGSGSGGVGLDQWRMQQQMHQFPFIGGLEPPPPPTGTVAATGMFHLDLESGNVIEGGGFAGQVAAAAKASGSGIIANLASVKMEQNPRVGLSLPRQFMGIAGRNDSSIWGGGIGGGSGGNADDGGGGSGGGGWAADLVGFNSSSTGNLL